MSLWIKAVFGFSGGLPVGVHGEGCAQKKKKQIHQLG